jgi:hypothetical protein
MGRGWLAARERRPPPTFPLIAAKVYARLKSDTRFAIYVAISINWCNQGDYTN